MPSETHQIIEEQLEKLPKDIRDAIVAADLPEKFKRLSTKHNLRIDQATLLETETMLVMLGLEHPDDYAKNLVGEVRLSKDKAEEVAEEVSRMIFLPIRRSLQQYHEAERAKAEQEVAAPVPQSAEISDLSAGPPVSRQDRQVSETKDERIDRRQQTFNEKTPTSLDTERSRGLEQEDVDLKSEENVFRQKLESQMRLAKETADLSVKPLEKRGETDARLEKIKADPYRETVEERDLVGIKQEGISESGVRGQESGVKKPATNSTLQAPNSKLKEHKERLTMTSKPTPVFARDTGVAGGPKTPPPAAEPTVRRENLVPKPTKDEPKQNNDISHIDQYREKVEK